MRIVKILVVALLAILGIGGSAYAVTFNGQDYSPEYTTGITEVYAVTENGVEVYVPVWSMEYCIDENAETQDACVWNAQTQGNGIGSSIVYLGGNEMAYISTYAADILVIPGTAVQNSAPTQGYSTEELSQVVPSQPEVFTESVISEGTMSANVYPMCMHEDGSGQSEDCVWVSSLQGNQNGAYSILYQGGYNAKVGTNISNEYAESIALR